MPATSMKSSTVTSNSEPVVRPAKKQIPNPSKPEDTIKVSLAKLNLNSQGYEYGTQCYYGSESGTGVYSFGCSLPIYCNNTKDIRDQEYYNTLRARSREEAKEMILKELKEKFPKKVFSFYR